TPGAGNTPKAIRRRWPPSQARGNRPQDCASETRSARADPADARAFRDELIRVRKLDDILTCEARARLLRLRPSAVSLCQTKPRLRAAHMPSSIGLSTAPPLSAQSLNAPRL